MGAMSTDDQPTERGPETSSTAAQVGSAVASLAEAWLRDTAYAAVGLLSFITAVCGFAAADGVVPAVVGVVLGVVGFGLPTWALVRRAPASQQWLTLLAGAVVAGGGLALVLLG